MSNYFSFGYITHQDFKELYEMKGFIVVRQKISSFSPLLDRVQFRFFWRNIKKLIGNKPIQKTVIEDGYVKVSGSAVMDGLVTKRVDSHFQEDDQNDFDKDLLSYFERILILCHQRGIKVVTLMIPTTDYYLKHAEKYVTRAALYEKVFSNPKYSPHIYRHLDYLDLYAKDHDLFVDGEHLNHDGAAAFSRLIAPELSKVMEEIKKGP
jgi:lysophospholipase L1-like esterase